jgi:peptide/nickel transport system ATP-binding protein
MNEPLLSIRNLSVSFHGTRRASALSDIDLDVMPGQVLGLLGESGCGKSVTLRTLLRLHPEATTRIEGSIRVAGQDVLSLGPKALDAYRGKVASMVFQEPGLAFDPVFTIGRQISECLQVHDGLDRRAAQAEALRMLERVQIPQARRRLDAYPHELSGGMRQRAMIALALACKPKLLLADEPTTALDATVQIQILLLLRELQRETGMALIFVTHDIGAAIEVADRVAVMYGGRIVEEGNVADIVHRPRHPYTAGLLAATVSAADRGKPLASVPGAPPDLSCLPPGCSFAPRCRNAGSRCRVEQPPMAAGAGTAARLACWHPVAHAHDVGIDRHSA